MVRKIFLLVILISIGAGFLFSATFKEVTAGIAILLFGMILLENGFSSFADGFLHRVLSRSTDKLYKSISLGLVSTALLQSSSLISVITISFISAGLISFQGALGIIFGANIGTTATAWLVSLFGLKVKISALAMPMLVFGIIMRLQRSKSWQGFGDVLAGLGFFFLGIHYMKDGFDGLGDSFNLADYALQGLLGLLTFTFLGIILTTILQSSSATMALILTALAAGQITYQNSLALAIGANIGTTITAILGAIGANMAGKRLAGGHLIFNLVTGIMALLFISQLADLVNYISDLFNLPSDNFVVKLSIFHSIFNVVGVLIMVPLIPPLSRFLLRIIPDLVKVEEGFEYPIYLNESAMAFPQSAFRALLNETRRLFEQTTFMVVTHGLNLHREDVKGEEKLKHIIKRSREEMKLDIDELYYKKVKIIYSKIIKYATIAQSNFDLSPNALGAFRHIKLATRNMVEVIKDIRGLHKNVSQYMQSPNKDIRKQYDRLRKRVSVVLREIYLTHHDEDPASHMGRLEELKAKSALLDALTDGTLDNLINERKITSEMATSLANDSYKVSGIISKLIESAELLYIDVDTYIVSLNGNQEESEILEDVP
ncbi:MAG: Na/Pi cotransporter family protein [Saprospiraceae bacterium]|nr:Na/Pi cotransporter family protein [Saprospiraceae bacterium]